jgi:DNA helicase MCM8
LEALVRLTEARAKLELREVATQEDAQDVIEIMASSMVDTFSDVSAIGSCGVAGKLDGSRSAGVCMSSRKASKLFLKALKQRAKAMNRSKFAVHEMKEVMAGCGANVENFGDFLSYLNVHGIMIKKGPKIFELLEVD